MGNRRLIGAEMEGCQVRDWIVGERDMLWKSKKRFNDRLWEINGGIYPFRTCQIQNKDSEKNSLFIFHLIFLLCLRIDI